MQKSHKVQDKEDRVVFKETGKEVKIKKKHNKNQGLAEAIDDSQDDSAEVEKILDTFEKTEQAEGENDPENPVSTEGDMEPNLDGTLKTSQIEPESED